MIEQEQRPGGLHIQEARIFCASTVALYPSSGLNGPHVPGRMLPLPRFLGGGRQAPSSAAVEGQRSAELSLLRDGSDVY